ncbi:MAG TPA: adenylate/guanylate cyclase domain-containing protein, partial [Actinomycetota bacterium]|nr:adenylate/guanylate cyclase domain-containing protein [Actinomycetota bacterium]
MTCGSCGHDNKPDRKFCANCGSALAVVCSSCGTNNDPGDRFCGQCGAPLEAGAVAARPAGPTQAPADKTSPAGLERRLVSVLFCDLVGFTSFSETRDHEQVRETLGYYFDEAKEIVNRYGGTVNKFIGDAVMATWGSPIAHEDDAERAVRAALDVVDAVAMIGQKIGEPELKLRAGVLTGHAAVNPGAESEGMVIGDMVNTASRIQSIADPGAVMVGESTYLASKLSIAFEPSGEVNLKGKEEPVAVWRALRVIAGVKGREKSTGIEAPFVGRDGELRTLKELLHATRMEGRPRLVSIGGIAGVGKSRLIDELSRYVDGLKDEFFWHQGRCPSYGDGITFWALAEMVRTRAGIAEDEDDDVYRSKLSAALDLIRLEPTERPWIEAALSSLIGLETASEEAHESMFPAWRTFYERIAEEDPVVMVFQDLQWADDGTIAFIEHMLEWTRSGPILIITLFRPDFLERKPTWGVGQRNFASIHLEPLSDESMVQLLDGVVVDFPADVKGKIVERAAGVPLYAVEMVRAMVDRGQLAEHDGRYTVAAELADIEVPDSLHALIAARLDVLAPDERAIVQQASVLGQTFTIQSLAALADRGEIELTALLKDLSRRELMYLDVDPMSPERGQYGFVQGMIREVAYSTIAHKNRLALQVKAATYFEGLQEIDLASVVSNHYQAAYELATDPNEARELADKALNTLVDAADRAASLGSYEQALTQLIKAADLADDARKIELHQRAAEMALSAGRFDDADRLAGEAADRARESNDRVALFRMAVVRAQALRDLGRYENEIEVLTEPLDWEDDSFRDAMRAKALVAQALMLLDRPKEALEWCDRTLRSEHAVNDPAAVVDALITRGVVGSREYNTIEGLVYLMGARSVAERFELDEARERAAINVAAIILEIDTASGYEIALEGLEHSRAIGNRYLEINHAVNAQMMGFQLGKWDAIQTTAEDMFGEPPLEHLDGSLSGVQCQAVLASVIALRGDHALAGEFLDRVEQGDMEDPWTVAQITLDRGRVALAQGDWSSALEAALVGSEHVDVVSSEWMPIALAAAAFNKD